MKNIGKLCTGKPYARFDEGGLVKLSMKWLLKHRQTKGAETDRLFLQMIKPALYSTQVFWWDSNRPNDHITPNR